MPKGRNAKAKATRKSRRILERSATDNSQSTHIVTLDLQNTSDILEPIGRSSSDIGENNIVIEEQLEEHLQQNITIGAQANMNINNADGGQQANNVTFDAATLLDYEKLSKELTHKGFNSVTMRETLVNNYTSHHRITVALSVAQKTDIAKSIVMCIIAYIKTGNSSSKAQTAVKDNALSGRLSEAMRSFDVRDTARGGEGVTLARIAISMVPLVYLCGIMCGGVKRFNIECPLHLQDPCFRGVPEVRDLPGYKAFLEKWNEAMSNTAGAKGNKKNINWDDVAILGYESDRKQSAEMVRVLGIDTSTSALAIAQLAYCAKNLLFP